MFKPSVTVNIYIDILMYRILFHSPGHEKQQSLRYLTAELPYLGTGWEVDASESYGGFVSTGYRE